MTGVPTDVAENWVYQRLAADSALVSAVGGRIYINLPPTTATYPLVLINIVPGAALLGVGTTHVLDTSLARIRVVSKNQTSNTTKAARKRVYAALHGAQGITSDGAVLSCVKDIDIPPYQELSGTDVYWHPGAQFRLNVQ